MICKWPPLEQVRPRIGCLNPVADHVRQRRLDDLPRVARLLRRPVPERRAARRQSVLVSRRDSERETLDFLAHATEDEIEAIDRALRGWLSLD